MTKTYYAYCQSANCGELEIDKTDLDPETGRYHCPFCRRFVKLERFFAYSDRSQCPGCYSKEVQIVEDIPKPEGGFIFSRHCLDCGIDWEAEGVILRWGVGLAKRIREVVS